MASVDLTALVAPVALTLLPEQEEAAALLAESGLLLDVAEAMVGAGVDPADPHADFNEAEDDVLDVLTAADDDVLYALSVFGDLTWDDALRIGDVVSAEDDVGPALYWATRAIAEEPA